MRKIFLILALLFGASVISVKAQNYTVNPIPSYNYLMTSSQALFSELRAPLVLTKEKRDMDVIISTANHSPVPIMAKVWVVKLAGNIFLGPYYISPNQLLTVGIDNGKWSVVIQCEWEVYASVWTD